MFGLLPLRYDVNQLKMTISKFWHSYCLIVSLLFVFAYPFALVHIINNRTENNDSGIAQIVEKLHYCATYAMAISVYIRQIFFSRTTQSFINNGMDFYSRVENSYPNQKFAYMEFTIPYVSRAVYSYIGYTFVNYLTLTYFYGELKNINYLFVCLYFLPDIVITSTNIRFHSAIIMQTMTLRRLNTAFTSCINSINRRHGKSTYERKKYFVKICEQFNMITIFHEQIWAFRSTSDRLFSNIVLCAIINAFMNLTWVVKPINCSYFLFIDLSKINFSLFQLFFLYIHLVTSDPLHSDYIAYTMFRSSLYSIDLIFIFSLCNKLKKEMRKTGLIIHDIYVVDADEQLYRNV